MWFEGQWGMGNGQGCVGARICEVGKELGVTVCEEGGSVREGHA